MVAFVLHDDRGQVVGVGQIAHGAEGNVDVFVDVVVAVLHLMLEHADDLVGDAVEANVFAKRVLAREKFFLRIGADHGDARVREVVGFTEESAFGNVHFAHAAVTGIDAADAVIGAARAVGDECTV